MRRINSYSVDQIFVANFSANEAANAASCEQWHCPTWCPLKRITTLTFERRDHDRATPSRPERYALIAITLHTVFAETDHTH